MGFGAAVAMAVLLQLLLCGGARATCKRAFTTTATITDDCSTHDPQCLVHGTGPPDALEFPDPNTRTCYRTCHDDKYSPTICNASLTGVHNQNISVDSEALYNANSSRTIFSPNFNDDKNYRKSTICRYDVTCPEGEVLAYQFLNHTLEEDADCPAGDDTCVDYVEVYLDPSIADRVSCGTAVNLSQVFADGFSGAIVEFYANREEQAAGFSMSLMCYDPDVGLSKRKRESGSNDGQSEPERCLEVTEEVQRQVDSAKQLRKSLEVESAREDLRPENIHDRCTAYTVRELETVQFKDGHLTISSRRREGESVTLQDVPGNVNLLAVSTRFESSRVFRRGSQRSIRGYARFWVCGDRAYLHRLGINPEDRPTPEETDIIFRLRKAVSEAVECDDFFDVYDAIDAEEAGVPFEESRCQKHFRRDEALDRLALRYEKACNIFLRAAARTYQAVILRRDCSGQRCSTN